jgi:hypothetical protein
VDLDGFDGTFSHGFPAMVFLTNQGRVTVHTTDDDGKDKVVTEHLDLQPDVANGMVLTLLKNIRSDAPQTNPRPPS